MDVNRLVQIIKDNVTVYTRTLREDYTYHLKSPLLDDSKDLKMFYDKGIDMIYEQLGYNEGTTDWYKLNTSNGVVILRGVRDGKTDGFGRKINRIEGCVVPHNIIGIGTDLDYITEILVKVLNSLKIKSNNYSYGNIEENKLSKTNNNKYIVDHNANLSCNKTLSNTIEKLIEDNITVYTRTLTEDYTYHFKSPLLDNSKDLKRFIDNGITLIHKSIGYEDGITSWHKMIVSEGIMIFRGVRDGKTDGFGRKINRIEGSIVPHNIINGNDNLASILNILEKTLNKCAMESNNYSYVNSDLGKRKK